MTISTTTWESIASPVSRDQACGEDLRLDEGSSRLLYHIRHLRHQATSEERQVATGDVDKSALQTRWKEIFSEVVELLTTRSKDLELLTYLLESALRLDGFDGLHRCLNSVTHLVVNHWPDLHPCTDRADDELRIRHLNGLNGIDGDGTLLPVIATTPLLGAPHTPAITLSRYLRAQDTTGSKSKRDERQDVLDSIKSDAASVSSEIVQASREAIDLATNAFKELDEQLTSRSHAEFFTSAIRGRLQGCQEAFAYIFGSPPLPLESPADMTLPEHASEDIAGSTEPEPDDSADNTVVSVHANTADAQLDSVRSRQQAMDSLVEIARYFERSEPHSPIGYAVRQIIDWGNMKLPQLMEHLIPDAQARDTFFLLSGIPTPRDSELD
ncbi:MAG: type VI secretion system protein TssA [Planctomycetaceae bacterium]|nr:type VI secretion system protein TssA [Planctomycetaceae bacterium]